MSAPKSGNSSSCHQNNNCRNASTFRGCCCGHHKRCLLSLWVACIIFDPLHISPLMAMLPVLAASKPKSRSKLRESFLACTASFLPSRWSFRLAPLVAVRRLKFDSDQVASISRFCSLPDAPVAIAASGSGSKRPTLAKSMLLLLRCICSSGGRKNCGLIMNLSCTLLLPYCCGNSTCAKPSRIR